MIPITMKFELPTIDLQYEGSEESETRARTEAPLCGRTENPFLEPYPKEVTEPCAARGVTNGTVYG